MVPPTPVHRPQQGGSAVAEFVMVVALLTAVFVSVLQVSLVLHVRNTMLDAAAAGARHGTLSDRTPADGAARTREIISTSLSPFYAHDVAYESISIGGEPGVRIVVSAGMPLIGLVPGMGSLRVQGEAVRYG